MCGRFTLTARPEDVAETFGLDATLPLAPRFNVAPGQDVASVDAASGRRVLSLRRWGLVPAWADSPAVGSRMINARCETVAERPAYRDAFRRRRCLVPADGFFEWADGPAPRQPHFVHRADRSLFAIAGLWERWRAAEGEVLESCVLLTTDANRPVSALHPRMPVILPPSLWSFWLDPDEHEPGRLAALFEPWPDADTVVEPVAARVNDVRVDGPECIAPIPPPPVQGRLL